MKRFLSLLLVLLLVPFAAAYGVTFYSPQMSPQFGKVYDLVEADKPYVAENPGKDVAITKITFMINRSANNAGITIYNLRSIPDSIPAAAENESYQYVEIKYSGFVPFDTKKFVYAFRVDKGWLENMSISRDKIALHVLNKATNEWATLDTKITNDDADYVYYSAEGRGVHFLLIGKSQSGALASAVEKQPEPVKESEGKTGTGEETSKEEISAVAGEVTPIQQEIKSQPAAQPQVQVSEPAAAQPSVNVQSSQSSGTGMDSKVIGAFALVAIAVIILVIYLIWGKGSTGSSVDRELNNYISESLKRGKTKSEVRQRLLEVGWHAERVEKALSKHRDAEQARAAELAKAAEHHVVTAKVADVLEKNPAAKDIRHHEKSAEKPRKK
jgi:PGF-pre-PGF domain-containing protein